MNLGIILAFIFGILFVASIIFIAFFLMKRKDDVNSKDKDNSLIMLQNQISELTRLIDSKIGESNKVAQHQFSESINIIKDVTEKLTRLDETNKQVINITDQLKSLQDILKNPKQRGVLGEYYLETVLKNVLPPDIYKMQYEFSNGEIVDAVVFVKDKIIPIDSKFSLENYNRMLEAETKDEMNRFANAFIQDLKIRVDETSKYIRPEEGTTEFAFMFIPSEAVYYDLLVNKIGALKESARNIMEYASGEKKVIIVSPTTFLAYLQTVLQGLKALQIEESAKEIKKRVGDLGRHLLAYQSYFEKIGSRLDSTVNAYNSASKEFRKIDKDVLKMSGEGFGYEPNLLDKTSKSEEEAD